MHGFPEQKYFRYYISTVSVALLFLAIRQIRKRNNKKKNLNLKKFKITMKSLLNYLIYYS